MTRQDVPDRYKPADLGVSGGLIDVAHGEVSERRTVMAEADYQQAVQALIDRLGGRWQGLESDGRDEMERVLRDELGYDRRRAHETIDTMIEVGTLRYHREARHAGHVPANVDDTPIAVPATPVGTGAAGPTGFGGVLPVASAVDGYWQIGREIDDTPGRAGQVQAS